MNQGTYEGKWNVTFYLDRSPWVIQRLGEWHWIRLTKLPFSSYSAYNMPWWTTTISLIVRGLDIIKFRLRYSPDDPMYNIWTYIIDLLWRGAYIYSGTRALDFSCAAFTVAFCIVVAIDLWRLESFLFGFMEKGKTIWWCN